MKLVYATPFDAHDVTNWSGTPFYMSNAFREAGDSVDYVGGLSRRLPPFFKLKQTWKKIAAGQRESPRFNITAATHYSEQVSQYLKTHSADVVLSPQLNPIAYLDCTQPIVLWTDALYASLLGFYPGFTRHSAESVRQGNLMAEACLSRCRLAIFSSDWAARTAIEIYGADREKVKVVPFGANMPSIHTKDDIRRMLKSRARDTVKLLFLGKHWHRKGGDIVFAVAKALHEAGQPVELHFVGCYPPADVAIPPYIHCHGFISKRTSEGIEKMSRLLRESHFLFVPSRAEAYGIVFCEANAFGLPCLTSYVGGISTIVKDHVNGMTFSLDASPKDYCDYIMDVMNHTSRYEELALSAFNEYETRLNWRTAVSTVKQLITVC
ncbi:MAG TPA: glycosyltransferase family 4 protein [Gammaproteobacteria bacterium]|nr:glycosyltransferase family 4 protein [Gammaproteobacteria bacterium]